MDRQEAHEIELNWLLAAWQQAWGSLDNRFRSSFRSNGFANALAELIVADWWNARVPRLSRSQSELDSIMINERQVARVQVSAVLASHGPKLHDVYSRIQRKRIYTEHDFVAEPPDWFHDYVRRVQDVEVSMRPGPKRGSMSRAAFVVTWSWCWSIPFDRARPDWHDNELRSISEICRIYESAHVRASIRRYSDIQQIKEHCIMLAGRRNTPSTVIASDRWEHFDMIYEGPEESGLDPTQDYRDDT